MHCAFIVLKSVEDYQTADVNMQDQYKMNKNGDDS